MPGNPYRYQKGHLTTKANDGGPCMHDAGGFEIKKPATNREANNSDEEKAMKLLGVNKQEQQKPSNNIVYFYKGKKLKVKDTKTENGTRMVLLDDYTN